MRDLVLIKSFLNGITLNIDAEAEFEAVTAEIASKFRDARGFFKSSGMALQIEGRALSAEEESKVLDAIYDNCDLRILCIVSRDPKTEEIFTKGIENHKDDIPQANDNRLFKGSLKDKDVLETDDSIVIMGDVLPGGCVISPGSVIVLGTLLGEAYAGEGCYITALNMDPERLSIGDIRYKKDGKSSKGFLKAKTTAKTAVVKDGKIVLEPLQGELPAGF